MTDQTPQIQSRIAIIDDHDAIRDAITLWCRSATPEIGIASTYRNPDEFLADRRARAQLTIDAVVLDLQFDERAPDLAPLEKICGIGYRVVVYSQHTDPGLVLDCLDRGTVTYLSKAEGRDHLTAAVQAATGDHPYLSPTMAKAMTADRTTQRPRLTQRERDVLLAWFQTESKEFAAQSLLITSGTVSTHLARIRTKYANSGRPAPTKAALVARAIQDGLIDPRDL